MKASKAREITNRDIELQTIFDKIKAAAKNGESSIQYSLNYYTNEKLRLLGYDLEYVDDESLDSDIRIINW